MSAVQFFILASMIFLAPALSRLTSICFAIVTFIFAELLKWGVV